MTGDNTGGTSGANEWADGQASAQGGKPADVNDDAPRTLRALNQIPEWYRADPEMKVLSPDRDTITYCVFECDSEGIWRVVAVAEKRQTALPLEK